MTFDELLQQVGETTARSVRFQFNLYSEGRITEDAMRSTVQSLLELAGTQGANYGQIAYAQHALAMTGAQPATVADIATTVSRSHTEIAQKSLATLWADGDIGEVIERVIAVAEALPIQAIQESFGDSLARDVRVEGWTRGLDPGACQLCEWWWREGGVWPKFHPMPTHSGCRCQQIPTYAEDIAETQKTQGLTESQLKNQTDYYERLREGATE